MNTTALDPEKNCVVLGDLDGARFVKALSALLSDLSRLETFVANLSDAIDVASKPMASIGYEVDRDAVLVDHLDETLSGAISQLIDLLATTRMARAKLERAGAEY